mmetsp:Transcript_60156/g.176513  ORF Transcript_60156/g.176513 Transcript_60156/m.176513 type:complete len:209 (-) Transcript_60156:221-847(-)
MGRPAPEAGGQVELRRERPEPLLRGHRQHPRAGREETASDPLRAAPGRHAALWPRGDPQPGQRRGRRPGGRWRAGLCLPGRQARLRRSRARHPGLVAQGEGRRDLRGSRLRGRRVPRGRLLLDLRHAGGYAWPREQHAHHQGGEPLPLVLHHQVRGHDEPIAARVRGGGNRSQAVREQQPLLRALAGERRRGGRRGQLPGRLRGDLRA